MFSAFLFRLHALALVPGRHNLLQLLDAWSDDAFDFVRLRLPRILAVLIVAFVLIRLLRVLSRHVANLSKRQGLPSALRNQQLRTLASVVYSIGAAVVLFLATMQILLQLGVNMGPLLASAGVAGIAIGFGAQTLVKDYINGFLILVENQYDIGDTVRLAGVQGVVETMTLRRTVLRDDSGAVHNVPSSSIQIVTNMTRDWTQLPLHISVAYGADSDKVIRLLQEVGEELAADPKFADAVMARPEVPGIDKVSGSEVDYLMLVRTRPGAQYTVTRELRRRIKASFEKQGIEPGNPNRVYVADPPKPG